MLTKQSVRYMMRRWESIFIYTFIILCILPQQAWSSDDDAKWEAKVDSLKALAQEQIEEERIKTYFSILKEYRNHGSLDSAIHYCNLRIDLCKKYNNSKELAKMYDFLGRLNFMKGDVILAIDAFDRGLKVTERNKNKKLNAHLKNSLGIAFRGIANYEKALSYFFSALEYWEEIDDKNQYNALLNIGNTYMDLKDYPSAEANFQKALALSRKFQKVRAETKILNSLALLFLELEDYKNALSFFEESYEIKVAEDLTQFFGTSYYNLGEANML